jgi:hypothetical protein
MQGRSVFRSGPGGWLPWRRRQAGQAAVVSDQLARLNRLENELARACARYERAIAALDELADHIEHPRAEEVVRAAMGDSQNGRSGDTYQVNLSSATFEDLRALGLSVTQAYRVLKLRDRGELRSTAGLDSVPGLPRHQVATLKLRLRD